MADMVQPASEQATEAASPKPAPIPLVLPPAGFTSAADAFKVFLLKCPITVEGRDHKLIGIRRFTVDQIAAITANFRANLAIDPDAKMALPIYVDDQGQDLPKAVLGFLTPDEFDDLDKETFDFLPRRFRPAMTAPEDESSPPEDGKSTEPSF